MCFPVRSRNCWRLQLFIIVAQLFHRPHSPAPDWLLHGTAFSPLSLCDLLVGGVEASHTHILSVRFAGMKSELLATSVELEAVEVTRKGRVGWSKYLLWSQHSS